MTIRSHHDLVAWQKSLDLTVAIYRLSGQFPREELYRLTAQLTRAAASVPANRAEGSARASRR
jgi:four helix bundle protein